LSGIVPSEWSDSRAASAKQAQSPHARLAFSAWLRRQRIANEIRPNHGRGNVGFGGGMVVSAARHVLLAYLGTGGCSLFVLTVEKTGKAGQGRECG